jgi:hypothetical protein
MRAGRQFRRVSTRRSPKDGGPNATDECPIGLWCLPSGKRLFEFAMERGFVGSRLLAHAFSTSPERDAIEPDKVEQTA